MWLNFHSNYWIKNLNVYERIWNKGGIKDNYNGEKMNDRK